MFKKKTEKMHKEEKKEEKTSEKEGVQTFYFFYDISTVRNAIRVLNDCVNNGQIKLNNAHNSSCRLFLINNDLVNLGPHSTVDLMGNYGFNPLSYGNIELLSDSTSIKSGEAILEEERKVKLDKLQELKDQHSKSMLEIEKLARELGVQSV